MNYLKQLPLKKTGTIMFSMLLATCLLWMSFFAKSGPETAYINSAKVFAEFKGKIELERNLKKKESYQQSILDSLESQINVLKTKYINGDETSLIGNGIREKETEFLQLKQQFLDEQQEESLKYTEEIWKQINQFVSEYGSKQGYDFILGANGDGSIMYASEAHDITLPVIKFINARYEDM